MSLSPNPFYVLSQTLSNKHLRVGAVIYRHCDFTTPPKPKYLLVVSVEPRLLVLMINSKINTFYVKKNLVHLHVLLSKAEHSFLVHDSYTNCIEAHNAFDIESIRKEVIENYSDIFKGWITNKCLADVYNAVKNNDLIRIGHQREILLSIENLLHDIAM